MNTQATGMWDTRPTRIPSVQGSNAKIAGVCEGIGVRFQVDPTLVRLMFVVTAVWGGGIAAYLIAWLIMPRYSIPKAPVEVLTDPEPRYASERRLGWVLLVIVAIPTLGSWGISSGFSLFPAANVFTLTLFAAGWYWLYTRTPVPPAIEGRFAPVEGFETPYPQPGADSVLNPLAPLSPWEYTQADAQDDARSDATSGVTPPAWDPLGAAPFAWDLPDPAPAAVPQPAPAPVKASTPKPLKVLGWLLVANAAVITLGIGALAALGASHPHPDNGTTNSFGNVSVSYTTLDEDSISSQAGNIKVDLSDLEPLQEDTTFTVSSTAGNAKVTLPKNVRTEFTCDAIMGDIECDTSSPYNPDAPGHVLTLTVESTAGNVEVVEPER